MFNAEKLGLTTVKLSNNIPFWKGKSFAHGATKGGTGSRKLMWFHLRLQVISRSRGAQLETPTAHYPIEGQRTTPQGVSIPYYCF